MSNYEITEVVAERDALKYQITECLEFLVWLRGRESLDELISMRLNLLLMALANSGEK